MAIVKQVVGTKTTLSANGFANLASATYGVSLVKDNGANLPLDLLIELNIICGATVAPAFCYLFAKMSLDGSTYSSGPESGTVTTDEADLYYIGSIQMNTASQTYIKTFSVASAFGGVLPPLLKFVLKNSTGAALGPVSVGISEISATIV